MRKLSVHKVLFAASLFPLVMLAALLLPQNAISALAPHALPETSLSLVITGLPLLVTLLIDRATKPRFKHALLITLCLTSSGIATLCICHQLYPPQLDLESAIIPVVLLPFAAAGIVMGARSSGLRPGIASAVILALYTLPPLLMLLSTTIAQTPSSFLRSASPLWAWQSGADPAWGFIALGLAGLLTSAAREAGLRKRLTQRKKAKA